MTALLTALLLAQTYPILSGQTVNQLTSPGIVKLSVIGVGVLDVNYLQSGAAQGNMTITATPTLSGNPSGATQTMQVNPSTGSSTIALSPFLGTGVIVTWNTNGPTDFFNGVTLSVATQQYSDAGGGGGGGGGIGVADAGPSGYFAFPILVSGDVSAYQFNSDPGAPAPTCAMQLTNVFDGGVLDNPFDGGVSCAAGSNDQSGTLLVNVNPSGALVPASGYYGNVAFYVQPGTPYKATTHCQFGFGNPQTTAAGGMVIATSIDGGIIQGWIVGGLGGAGTPPNFAFNWNCGG